ncbi:enoyl-CoA hydratase-related protein [Rhizobium sp. C4]|nr:enoyl-CoA hydratase-related protein [Rhizobium sp. C4]
MNRPQARNALSLALRKAIAAAILESDGDPNTRAIVITGNETCFSAGGDIKEFPESANREDSAFVSQRIWAPLSSCRVPLIAAVDGIALGGGAEFAMLCDIIIAGEKAEFAFPEVRLGILPGNGGTQRFPRAVGKFKAMRYLLTGDRFSAREAADMGLVSEVVEAGTALAAALAVAQRIAEQPPLSVRQIKDVVNHGAEAPLAAALTLEREGSRILTRSQDHREASMAFIEKRRPVFTGK